MNTPNPPLGTSRQNFLTVSSSGTRHYRALPYLFSLLAILILTGCGGKSFNNRLQAYRYEPSRFLIESVPFHPQRVDHCGPASLAMTLNWSGVPISPDTLAPETFTPALQGSYQSAMIGSARRHGRIAYPISGPAALLAEVSSGHPVIILQNLGISLLPSWHYCVVIGYDLEEQVFIVHSGDTPAKKIPLDFFEYTWEKSKYWGLLVLPPEILPATAQEQNYISAVLGLERLNYLSEAIAGYTNALSRWPGSLAAITGLGNSYYASNQLTLAEQTFRRATVLHPNEGLFFNNLAQTLLDLGQKKEASIAAKRAVELGGPLVDTYRKTLAETLNTNNQ